MKKITYILLAVGMIAALGSCKNKKDNNSDVIIANKPQQQTEQAPQSTQKDTVTDKRDITWLDKIYTVIVTKAKDEELPQAVDENGKKYYDNKIVVKILREDGTEAFNHTFTKTDFKEYYRGEKCAEDGALLGVVLDKVDGDNLLFAASVGSPDISSDNYAPILMKVNRSGSISMSKDTRYDVSIAPQEQDDSN